MKCSIKTVYPIITALLLACTTLSLAQVPDDINGRLWRLCKVWGYAKYYHENNCNVNWNEMLQDAIDSVLVSNSNASFNQIITKLLNTAGQVSRATDSLVIESDININAHFDWIDDPYYNHEVQDILDSININFRPKENCLVKFNDGSYSGFGGLLSFGPDNILSIPSFSYTNESDRLLTLFYYWNIINYFNPNNNQMDQDWDSTLFQFIPLIREAQNDVEFHVRFLNLVTYLNDSHGFTGSSLITNYFGEFFPLLKIEYIENQTVVTKVGPAISDISVGDIIKKIGGIDISVYRDSLAQFVTASNENSLNRDLVYLLLSGPLSSNLVLELVDSTGASYNKTLSRKYTSQTYYDWIYPTDPNPVWEVTQCGYGYVNMGKLYPNHLPQMYEDLKDAPAIIFDVRNYPNNVIWDLVHYLYSSPTTWALFGSPDLTYPGWYAYNDNKLHAGDFSNPDPYPGKVIILVNAETQSHAEYTVMGLQQHSNTYTIGSQTAGADGNISYISLPGSLYTYWTTLGIYYPDSISAQCSGVRIDSIVTPTISGIRSGRDEVLEAALDCLTSANLEEAIDQALDVYPNPADELIYISADLSLSKNMKIEIFDMLGHLILERNYQGDVSIFSINVNHLPNGFYIFSLKDNNGVSAIRKILVQH